MFEVLPTVIHPITIQTTDHHAGDFCAKDENDDPHAKYDRGDVVDDLRGNLLFDIGQQFDGVAATKFSIE